MEHENRLLDYNQAIEESKKEIKSLGITCRYDVYDNDSIFNNPVYPSNEQLYNEFVDENGFDVQEYFIFIAKRIEME